MEAIPSNQLFEYNADTLAFLRKQYDLDKPERIDEAIAILQDWLNKEDHIVKKNYPEGYLERVIIASKGSVERAKAKFDKLATYRTLLPQFFEPINDLTKMKLLSDFIIVVPPKMTADHYRVFMLKNIAQHVPGLMDFFRYLIMICEYQQSHDYCNGIVAVFDYTEANMYELIKAVNVVEMQQALTIVIEGYSMRLKGIHFITPSKAIDTFVQLVKKTLSKKVADRIQVHKDMETVYKYVPKEIMPRDYGGQAKTLEELSSNLKSAVNSPNFMNHLRVMQKACTNENCRRDDKFNDLYMGTPGTFRKLSVD